MNSKFPSATLPIIFNTPLASSLLGRTVVGISSRLVEMEGTSLMSLSVIESLPMSMLSPIFPWAQHLPWIQLLTHCMMV
jgi:hypothetical protein